MASTATHLSKLHAESKAKKTVLVVEDEELVCEVTCDVLERCGYRVLQAHNAARAHEIAELAGRRVDLLLCDAVLPDENGIALARSLQRSYPGMQVILTSGYPARTLAAIFGHDVSTQFLTKPYSAASLIARIGRMIGSANAPTCEEGSNRRAIAQGL